MPFKDPNSSESIASARASRIKHYQNNKEQYYRRNKEKKDAMKAHLRSVKDVPCADCGIKYPYYVMDLDHLDPSQKSGEIYTILSRGSWKNFLAEIDKCDVVCANCHRERTWNPI